MGTQDDDRWLQVVAGQQRASNAEERKAAVLGDLLRTEAEEPQPLSDAQVKRMMNGLEAKGAFRPQAPAATARPAEPNPLRSLWRWLNPSGGAGRLGAVAAAVLALVVGVPVLQDRLGERHAPDDGFVEKGRVDGGVKSGPLESAGGIQQLRVPSPEGASGQLLLALGRHGVSARVDADQVARTVTAKVPDQRRAELAPDLQQLSVTVPADGHLVVRYEPER